jgi:FAD-linked sulfhydryl oxidase
MYLTARLYPCGECATEFQALLKQFPPQVRRPPLFAVGGVLISCLNLRRRHVCLRVYGTPSSCLSCRREDVTVHRLCSVHNEVNARLGKPNFDCSKLDAEYDCGCGDAPTSTTPSNARPTSSLEDVGAMEMMDFEWRDDVTGVRVVKGGKR